MAKDFAKPFYNSKAWKQCRASYIDKVHGLCERCRLNGKVTPGYIVHHIDYITPNNINNPFVTLNHDNLEYLCLDCHNEEHIGRNESTASGLSFDDYGNLVQK